MNAAANLPSASETFWTSMLSMTTPQSAKLGEVCSCVTTSWTSSGILLNSSIAGILRAASRTLSLIHI